MSKNKKKSILKKHKKSLKRKTNQNHSKLIRKRIYIKLYNTAIDIYIGDKDKARKVLKRITHQDIPDTSRGITFTKEGFYSIIYIPNVTEQGLIAHEVLHASWFILEKASVQLTEDNHEPLAYLMAYIIRELFK